MSTTFRELKDRLKEVEAERNYYESLVLSFLDGTTPEEGNSLTHVIFAQWGRKRLQELRGTPALLRGN